MSITRKSRYYKERYRTYAVRFNYEKDRDIIDRLENCTSITDYIRDLIRSDILGGVFNGKQS